MCLIIAPGADGKTALLPRDVFDYSYTSNNDGFGAMWVEDGRVQHFKGLSPSADEEYAKMEQMVADHPSVIFHMRYKTHGNTIPALSHPFRVLHKNRHGKDLFFMHNGVLSSFGNKLRYGQSDTTVFKDKILIPLLTRDPDALDDPEVFSAIEKMTNGSRLIFMDSDGKVWKTSGTAWNNRYGLALSNTYMLPTIKYAQSATTSGNVVTLGTPNSMPPPGFPMKRWIVMADASRNAVWVKRVSSGFCRTQGGSLYRDTDMEGLLRTPDYVPMKEEVNVLMDADNATLEARARAKKAFETSYPEVADRDDASFLNDDLPFNLRTPDGTDGDEIDELEDFSSNNTVTSATPASIDERLRYARLLHNTHDGDVVSRKQLLGDLLSMGDSEMETFIKEDPETAATIMAELFEIVLELNSVVELDPTCVEYSFDADELLELGSVENHQGSMKDMSALRRAEYERLTEAKAKIEKEKKVA